MNNDLRETAKEIFEAIESDLRDRSGIGYLWDQVDEEIQEEIRETNIEYIVSILKRNDL